MKRKTNEILSVVLFCGFLGIMAVLYFVLPKNEFSQLEKRYLASPPKVESENIFSGNFGKEVELYMADYMPARDFFVGVNSYFERATLRQVTEDIYVCSGNRLVEKPITRDEQVVEGNMKSINEFARQLNVPVDFMLIPSSGWAARNSVQGIANPYIDDVIISGIYAGADNVSVCNVTPIFENAPELFYRTDHHWTSKGAYLTYKNYMEMAGSSFLAEENFTVESVEGFHGTTYQRSALWLVPSEPIELWTASSDLLVSTDKVTAHKGVFFRERLSEADMYTVYLDGNHPLVTVENPQADNDETLVVVRDSYSNCLGGFLAQSYRRVILVDLRYYRESTLKLCRDCNVDRVLVCYSLSNFMSDKNFFKLTAES